MLGVGLKSFKVSSSTRKQGRAASRRLAGVTSEETEEVADQEQRAEVSGSQAAEAPATTGLASGGSGPSVNPGITDNTAEGTTTDLPLNVSGGSSRGSSSRGSIAWDLSTVVLPPDIRELIRSGSHEVLIKRNFTLLHQVVDLVYQLEEASKQTNEPRGEVQALKEELAKTKLQVVALKAQSDQLLKQLAERRKASKQTLARAILIRYERYCTNEIFTVEHLRTLVESLLEENNYSVEVVHRTLKAVFESEIQQSQEQEDQGLQPKNSAEASDSKSLSSSSSQSSPEASGSKEGKKRKIYRDPGLP